MAHAINYSGTSHENDTRDSAESAWKPTKFKNSVSSYQMNSILYKKYVLIEMLVVYSQSV